MPTPAGLSRTTWSIEKQKIVKARTRFFGLIRYRRFNSDIVLNRFHFEVLWWIGMLFNWAEKFSQRYLEEYFDSCYNKAHDEAVRRYKCRQQRPS